ncbi:MAG: STAS domain-containing protein [Acidimicrobiia bacterium]|nr:STAS domain-containing protein [Acidimicrobiia bacterium]
MAATPIMGEAGGAGPSHGGAKLVDEGDRGAVWLWGEHDTTTVGAVSAALADAAAAGEAHIVVDLRNVTFLDASTVGALVGSRLLLARGDRAMTLRRPSRSARRLLELTGLGEMIEPDAPGLVTKVGATTALATWIEVPTADPEVDRPSTDAPAPARTPGDPQRSRRR